MQDETLVLIHWQVGKVLEDAIFETVPLVIERLKSSGIAVEAVPDEDDAIRLPDGRTAVVRWTVEVRS